MDPLDIPTPVKEALRGVHKRIPEHLPYAQYTAMLDAVEALPDAAHQDAHRAIARERLDLLGLGTATDEEVERVLDEHAGELESMPLFDHAVLVRRVCLGRRALAERYLPPLITEAETSDPAGQSRLGEILRHALSVARGEVELLKVSEDGPKLPTHVSEGVQYAYRLQSMGWPYDDVMAVLDEIQAGEHAPEIATHRAILASEYEQEAEPDEP